MLNDYIHVISITLDRTALALILALALAALWLAPPFSLQEAVQRNRLLFICLVISALGAVAGLILRTAALADVPLAESWGFVPRVLSDSDYGFFWLLRAGAWLFMIAIMVWIWRRDWLTLPAGLLLFAAFMTALLISVTGHAGEDGLWSISNVMNWLHIISTSVWGGTVILYALLVLSTLRGSDNPRQTADVAVRLSTLAGAMLALVLITGIFNSWRQLGALADLWSTTYGAILLIKLALVAVMMTIGAFNRFRLVPQLEIHQSEKNNSWSAVSSRFLYVLRVDSTVFMLVLVAAVILGMQEPPSHDSG